MSWRLLLSVVCAVSVAMFAWQSPAAWGQHGHGHGGHVSGHGHGSFHGGHGYYGGHGHGHIGIHLGHNFVVPHISHHHHGSYWVDSGVYYYRPRTYVSFPGTYVVSKPAAIEFGGYEHVEDLTGRLSLLANDLCLDMHYNYQHNPGFAETYREAYQILDMAKYMQASDNHGDRSEIARRVQELDPLFHHVQAEVKDWSRRHQRQIGEGGVVTKTEIMESLLHHLMYDAGVEAHSTTTIEEAPVPATTEMAPQPASRAVNTPPPALP
jgi:hypothetical protein